MVFLQGRAVVPWKTVKKVKGARLDGCWTETFGLILNVPLKLFSVLARVTGSFPVDLQQWENFRAVGGALVASLRPGFSWSVPGVIGSLDMAPALLTLLFVYWWPLLLRRPDTVGSHSLQTWADTLAMYYF